MLHLDEARHQALEALRHLLAGTPKSVKAVLIDDLFGHIRVVLWPGKRNGSKLLDQTRKVLQEAAGTYWSGEIWDASQAGESDRLVYDHAWEEAAGSEVLPRKLRLLLRHRNRGAWLSPLAEPPWSIPSRPSLKRPPIVAFYSFKGGVGRSTALAAFAIQQARQGERIVVVDADLDAPGVGSLLAADPEGTTANWGVLDYLLERPFYDQVDLGDYYHACRREVVSGPGEILVFPTGRLDDDYLGKLARIDLEPSHSNEGPHPLHRLLQEIREQLSPSWILVDVRAGLANPAGFILAGIAHLYVLFGTFSEQSWHGLRLVIRHLGAKRVQVGKPQADCLLVQAMVPRVTDPPGVATTAFAERSLDEFTEHYYAAEGGEDLWTTVDDVESSDAPHVPVPLLYNDQLAYFRTIDEVADLLAKSEDYRALAIRILSRFGGGA